MLACPTCPPERLHHRLGEQLQPAAQMNAPPPSNSAVARKSRIAYDLLPPRNCSFPNSTRANCNNCLSRCCITFVPATVVRYSGAFEFRVFRASLTEPFVLRPTKKLPQLWMSNFVSPIDKVLGQFVFRKRMRTYGV